MHFSNCLQLLLHLWDSTGCQVRFGSRKNKTKIYFLSNQSPTQRRHATLLSKEPCVTRLKVLYIIYVGKLEIPVGKSSFRNKSCDLRRCSFSTLFGLFQLIWIYLEASRSPLRVKLYSFMYMHKISTQMNCVNGTMVIFLFMVNNVGTIPDS